jgi:hypothetical protein
MARMETHDRDNMCLEMLHYKGMARFVVLNNMDYGVMEKEELMVLSTNIPRTQLYYNWNGTIH